MQRTTRILASTLAIAALGVAGAQSGALATSATDHVHDGVSRRAAATTTECST